jgi:hypothetical protein
MESAADFAHSSWWVETWQRDWIDHVKRDRVDCSRIAPTAVHVRRAVYRAAYSRHGAAFIVMVLRSGRPVLKGFDRT